MKRCFISIELPEQIIDYIRELQKELKQKDLFSGKFTEPENLHLTLKFLGEINEEKIEKVKEKLSEIRFNEFEAESSNLGVFSERFIRIIWIKLEHCEKLQEEIDKKLSGLFPAEEKFMGHLTLARVKKVNDRKALLDFIKDKKISKVRFKVSTFFLKESQLTPEGPIYKTLKEFWLK